MAERWFKIAGHAKGDRTLEEQMLGLTPALEEARGRVVLDLGCAEGLIGREFVRAGASAVHGIEHLERHLVVAREQCAGLPMTFQHADIVTLARHEMPIELPQRYDIVLALAVVHKLSDPGIGLRFCAWSARRLVVLRLPALGPTGRGLIRSKYNASAVCHIETVMAESGFGLEKTLDGPRREPVQYWRRNP